MSTVWTMSKLDIVLFLRQNTNLDRYGRGILYLRFDWVLSNILRKSSPFFAANLRVKIQ